MSQPQLRARPYGALVIAPIVAAMVACVTPPTVGTTPAAGDQGSAEPMQSDSAPTRGELARTLEEFVREHPDVPRSTPDALFRLALLSEEAARERCEAAPDDGEPCELLGHAVARLVDLFERFPEYDHLAGVLVHAGFLEFERDHDSSAVRVWLALVCANRVPHPFEGAVPTPPLPEGAVCEARTDDGADVGGAWLRLGELWFDSGEPSELEAASRAFAHAVAALEGVEPAPRNDPRGEHPAAGQLVELARYKRAWTLYRLDRFGEALMAFAALGSGGGSLGPEARQYAALCIAERDWDGDGEEDAAHGLARPEVAAYLDAATLHEVASVYRDEARHGEARAAWRMLLAQFGQAPEAAVARAELADLQ